MTLCLLAEIEYVLVNAKIYVTNKLL